MSDFLYNNPALLSSSANAKRRHRTQSLRVAGYYQHLALFLELTIGLFLVSVPVFDDANPLLHSRPTSMLLHSFDDLLVKREPSYISNLYSRAQRERLACFSSGRFAFIASSTRGRTRQSMGNIYTSKNMDCLRSTERPHVMDEDFFTRLTAPVSFTSVVASEEMVVGISETMDET